MSASKKLYKYLPSQFVNAVIQEGILLFRNLSYFRQHEDNRRGDPLEGFHRDNPDNDITAKNPSLGMAIKGDFSFLNSTNTDLIYVFCLSKALNQRLFNEFEADACIEIIEIEEFLKRTKIAVENLPSVHNSGLLSDSVNYYQDNAPAGFDIKNPKNLSFAKGIHYQHQEEFRVVFGLQNAFDLTQQLVINRMYDPLGEAKKGVPKEKQIKIGNMVDIARIHYT
ncbi:MAG: hypothetical protein ABFD66_04760 [Smithella sp.]